MEVYTINGALYAAMLRSGAATLNANRQIVNDLNVFPIPDGDTGDNMFMTIDAGATTLPEEPAALGDVATLAARGMLMGARGNSGVILSRIFAGIARGLEGLETADAKALGRALSMGVKEAYGAVSVPVEGTILTVYRDAVDFANGQIREGCTLKDYFDDFNAELRRSLDRTPDLLDVLKEAGVVDSGGAGFIYIAQGMQDALEGRAAAYAGSDAPRAKTVDLDGFTEDSELEFGYCTEFLLRLQRSKVDLDSFDLEGLIRDLDARGDSLVCFREGTVIKVHIHTKTPGEILNFMQQYGEFLTLKIENMTLQHNETTVENRYVPKTEAPKKAYGLVTVAAGEGIRNTFLELGCDQVVDGGQSMNPAAEDLIAAFQKINAETILVYPNNSNIILTARQAAALYEGADIRIVPTRTVGEGYAALSMLDTGSGDTEAILQEQEELIAQVVTGSVSRAVRDTEKDGVAVHRDDYLGFVGDTIYLSEPERNAAALGLAKQLEAGDYDILLTVCGRDVPAAEREELQQALSAAFPRTEVILIDGGQPVFDYILIWE